MSESNPISSSAVGDMVAPKVVNRKHPLGSKGIKSSLEEVAKKVREGRNNVKIRELMIKIIHDAGGLKGEKQKTQAILDAHHVGYSYVSDPVHTEFMQGAALSWCTDDAGVCFKGGDCFPKGTLLLRSDYALVPIEEIKVGDRIWGRDDWTTVEGKIFKGVLDVDAVFLNNGGSIQLTPDHKVYVARCEEHKGHAKPCSCPVETRTVDRILVAELTPTQVLIQPKHKDPIWRLGTRYYGDEVEKLLRVKAVERAVAEVACYDISTSDHYVYLPENDVTVSNCDDAVIKVAAATLAAGIPTKIVGQAFEGDNGVPSHVILAIKDGQDWLRVDPSAKGFKVGDYAKAEKEIWIDPLEELTQMDFVGVGRVRERDFVGVGAPPNAPASPAVIDDARRVAVTSSLNQAVYSLRSSAIDLVASLDNLVATRRTLGLSEFDPSPPNERVNGPADFTPGKWTAGMSVYMQGLVFFSKAVLGVGDEGLSGKRRVLLDASGAAADIFIEKLPGDTRRYMPATLNGKSAVVITDGSNNVISVLSVTGEIFSQANGNIPSLPPGTLGLGPLVILGIVAGAVVSTAITAATVYYVTAEICDLMKVQAQERTQQKIIEAVASKAITVADAQKLTNMANQSRMTAAQAQVDKNNANPFTQAIKAAGNAVAQTGNSATNLVIALVVGGLALGGLYLYANSKSLVRVHRAA